MSPTVRLTFYGAAGTVTGSKFLVESDDQKVLVDCGLFQGKKELRLRNWSDPLFDPKKLTAVILTHAHIDHTGYLPLIVRRGFKGPIYCTRATFELLHLLLPDSAHLLKEEADFANRHGTSKHKPALPLYTIEDVVSTIEQIKTFNRNDTVKITDNVSLSARCAGHILGAVSLALDINGKRINFSGDIGQYNVPILPDPAPIDIGDLLLCESTYGGRSHSESDPKQILTGIINKAVNRGGPIIIPAFAVGRTQLLLYYLAELEREGAIPVLPTFIDSPMAINATKIYRMHKHDFDEDAQEILEEGDTPLLTERTKFCKTVKESKRLNDLEGPRVIISASGMVTGGRILHHMRHWLPKEETTVLFVGYQATQTRGQIIQSGAKHVRIYGQDVPIRAHVESISGLSAHGDHAELLNWLKKSNGSPKFVRAIHGEPESSKAFAKGVQEELGWDARPAEYMETLEF